MHSLRFLSRPIAVAAAASALTVAGVAGATPASHHAAAKATVQRKAFHDDMRRLWEDHITWTRLAIVSFAAGDPDLKATEARLLANQTDVGDAIKPFYGAKAGNRLTALLRQHILGAVDVLQAAKAGDKAALAKANAAWYANANQIADFLSKANPRNWPRAALRSMMKMHLDETLKEASDELTGHYAASVTDYDHVHHHILAMADALSGGIVRQFPSRFR